MACSFFNVDDIPLHTPNYNKVFVSGLCENTSDELIRLFFENQRRTGGGKIEHLNRIAETYAIIEFKYSKDAAAVEKSGTFILDDHALHVCFYHVVPKLNAKGAYGSTSGRECVNNFSPERSKNVSVCDNIYSDTNQFDERLSAATNMSMYLKSYTMTLDKPGYSEYLLGLKGQMFLKQIGISNTCSIDTSTSNHISERGQNTSEINALSKQNDDLYYTHSHFKRAGGNNPSRISKAIRVTEGVIATGKSDALFLMSSPSVKVISGELEKSESEVIVCPIHPSFDMKRGFLSTSIMNAGGEVIQQQLTSFFKSTTVKFGKVVHTTGGRLFGGRCKAIFHISLPLWKVDEGKAMQKAVQKCLYQADNLNVKSIAFPKLGSHKLGYPCSDVAKMMHLSIVKYFQDHPHTHIKNVTIVIHSLDTEGFMAFQNLTVFSEQFEGGCNAIDSKSLPGVGCLDHAVGGITDAVANKAIAAPAVTIKIYSNSDMTIMTVKDEILAHLSSIFFSETIECRNLADFSWETMSDLDHLQQKSGVTIRPDKVLGLVKFSGEELSVMRAIIQFKNLVQSLVNKAPSFTGFNRVLWQFQVPNGNFYNFPREQARIIELAFKNHKPEVCVNGNKKEYNIVFKDWKEYCITDKNIQPVAVRRRDLCQENSEMNLPKHWEAMDGKSMRRVMIDDKSEEFRNVASKFGERLHIKKIERIQNPALFQMYRVKKSELEKYNTNDECNERKLFHGTSSDSVDLIVHNGFNRSFCGKNGIAYGAGVYFAVSPKLSLGYSESNIFMARVLVGESVRGNRDMKMPPLKPGTNRHYDSATDSQSRLFVIFHDTQAYPEYLISF